MQHAYEDKTSTNPFETFSDLKLKIPWKKFPHRSLKHHFILSMGVVHMEEEEEEDNSCRNCIAYMNLNVVRPMQNDVVFNFDILMCLPKKP